MKAKEEIAHYIASIAQRAILYEVSTTPKPGLVDRENSGAHKDMDFFTFMASSSSLYRGMYQCALEGFSFEDEDKRELLNIIRKPGIQCEKEMFKATDGVNTHKGIIFSLGILSAVVGSLYRKHGFNYFSSEEICEEVKKISEDLSIKDFRNINDKAVLTHGERLYKQYGFKGIRGEVESGFYTVRKSALGLIRQWQVERVSSLNDLFLEILIHLMAYSEDTNVIIRGGVESLEYVKAVSKDFLKAGGMKQVDAKEKLNIMNSDFIERNISPGGSADLLAVTIFLGMAEGIIK